MRRRVTNGTFIQIEPGTSARFIGSGKTLDQRLWERIRVGEPWECWLWTGAKSRGGRNASGFDSQGRRNSSPQTIFYGTISEGGLEGGDPHKLWRTNILVSLLKVETLQDVPMDEGEDFISWLRRAKRYYLQSLGMEAAHLCDESLCCNPNHLAWQDHNQNIADQKFRIAAREKDPAYLEFCCSPEGYRNGTYPIAQLIRGPEGGSGSDPSADPGRDAGGPDSGRNAATLD